MNKPLVSIIIPVHNSEKYLEMCLQSCFNQNVNKEIICVLNGSVDNSKKILDNHQDKIRIVILSEANIGKARNEGINLAKGDYLYFLDSDDYLEKNALKQLIDKAVETNADITFSDYVSKFEKSGEIKYTKTFNFDEMDQNDIRKKIYKLNFGPTKLFKTNIIKDNKIFFPEDIKYEDVPFMVYCLKHSKKISKLNEAVFTYVVHSGSETTTRDEKMFDIFKVIESVNSAYGNFGNELITKLLTNYNLQQRYINSFKERKKFFTKSFTYLNTNIINWKKSQYIKELPFYKRIIETNKIILSLYCLMYNLLNRK